MKNISRKIIRNSSINSPDNCGVNEICKGNVSPERRSSVGGANSNGGN
jgi:hypothetical protein